MVKKLGIQQGSLYYQPKQCTIRVEIPQNDHRLYRFVLFDPPKIDNLMTPGPGYTLNRMHGPVVLAIHPTRWLKPRVLCCHYVVISD